MNEGQRGKPEMCTAYVLGAKTVTRVTNRLMLGWCRGLQPALTLTLYSQELRQ